jgi:hypothetical protein
MALSGFRLLLVGIASLFPSPTFAQQYTVPTLEFDVQSVQALHGDRPVIYAHAVTRRRRTAGVLRSHPRRRCVA